MAPASRCARGSTRGGQAEARQRFEKPAAAVGFPLVVVECRRAARCGRAEDSRPVQRFRAVAGLGRRSACRRDGGGGRASRKGGQTARGVMCVSVGAGVGSVLGAWNRDAALGDMRQRRCRSLAVCDRRGVAALSHKSRSASRGRGWMGESGESQQQRTQGRGWGDERRVRPWAAAAAAARRQPAAEGGGGRRRDRDPTAWQNGIEAIV
jgi:hypothetical protein